MKYIKNSITKRNTICLILFNHNFCTLCNIYLNSFHEYRREFSTIVGFEFFLQQIVNYVHFF